MQSGALHQAGNRRLLDRLDKDAVAVALYEARDAQVGEPAFAEEAAVQFIGYAQATDMRVFRLAGRHRHEIGSLGHLREEIGRAEFLPQDCFETRIDRLAHLFPARTRRCLDRVQFDHGHAAAPDQRFRRRGSQVRIEDVVGHFVPARLHTA